GGNAGGVERLRQPLGEPGRVLRGHEIKARGGAPRIGRVFSRRHGHRLPPQSGGLGAFIEAQSYETVKTTKPAWSRRPGIGPNALRNAISEFRLCRFLLQVLLPLPARGEAVHHGAVDEGALGGRDVFAPAGPGLLRRRLQRAAVAEG